MLVNISYSLAGLHEAARFIWENNTSISRWPTTPKTIFDVMSGMQDMMRKDVLQNATVILNEKRLGLGVNSEWLEYTGTGGYYFIYELISDDNPEEVVIGATILVDPAVGTPEPEYVTEFVDEIKETI